MFSLADLYEKVVCNQWQGSLRALQGATLTAQLCEQALALLQHGQIQWQPGDRMIIRAHSDAHTIATMLAAWYSGLVVVPVKDDISDSAIDAIARDCNAKALWQQGQYVSLSCYTNEPKRFELTSEHRVTGVDLALLIYTSGSTGKPKGIMLTHQNVLTAVQSISQYLRLSNEDRILCLSPLSFDYGLYQALFALYCDCTTLFYELSFNPIQVLKTLTNEAITVLPIVPAMGAALIKIAPLVKPDLSRLNALTNTGGHLSESVIRDWKEYCSHLNVYSMYGLTECKRAMFLEPEYWDKKMGSVGKPIPGLDARIFIPDEQGERFREANSHEVGELFVRGSAVMQSYYDPQAKGGAQIVAGHYRDDNWMATGDLFSRDEDGFYYFKGRTKELIKQAGFCLYPKDLENIIDSCSLVHLSAVIGSKDKNNSEIAICVIELNVKNDENQKEFLKWIKENLDSDYTPREFKFVDSISLTANSKVDKNKLASELS